jgi:beta-aspartyl-peptidase (threonine type)
MSIDAQALSNFFVKNLAYRNLDKNLTLRIIFATLLFLALVSNFPSQAQNPSIPVLVIHGGAGTIERGMLSDSMEAEIRNALQQALDSGYVLLEAGGTAIDAVTKTISMLEDCPHFNAGKGAVMTEEGRHELDASLMDGNTLDAGAISGVTNVKNPIKAALAVLRNSPHVMLAGSGAETFAESQQLELVPNTYFTTPRIRESWELGKARGHAPDTNSDYTKFGTVGAVAMDTEGNIAAGTSTGGIMNKKHGRIGDSPIIGAGTYADNATCGVSCTGQGEYFIRIGVAKEISDQMQFGNKSLDEAVQYSLHKRLTGMNALGGLIAIDRDGNMALEFNTPGMYRGYKKGNTSKVIIYGNE